jgi:hypothetical protein
MLTQAEPAILLSRRKLGVALALFGGAVAVPVLRSTPAFAAGVAGPILPSSIYLGGASGNLFPNFYIPATNTNTAGALEGIGVVASLGANAPAVMQFNMPEVMPVGTIKLRCLAMANATAGVAKLTVSDKNVAAGASLGTSTLNSETQLSQTWVTADILVENKITLTSAPAANDVLTVLATFNNTGWTLAAASTWQFSIVWE